MRSKEICVVDDDFFILKMTREILEGEGYSVREFSSPKTALEVVEAPRLLITDLKMPEMDGFALLKNFRIKFPGDNIPCLLITSTRLDNPIVTAFRQEEGMENILFKPFEVIDLLDYVKRKVT